MSLAFVLMLLMSVSANAQFQASRTGVNYPVTLKVGQSFSIKGMVTANENIARAAVTIYDAAGTTCLQRYSVTPNTKVFNIAEADSSIIFNTLKEGEYYYRVSIFDSANTKFSVVNRKFEVKSSTEKPTLTKTAISYPVNLPAGKAFSMSGQIKTNFKFKNAVFTIYDSTGNKCLQRYSVNVNGTSYDIKNADEHLKFDVLKKGRYYYRICIYNMAGQKIRVLNKKFKVVANSSITITKPVPAANTEISYGAKYSIGGTIKSVKKLTNVTGTIFDSTGKAVYSKSVNPSAKTYTLDVSAIDKALYFEKLPAGTYTVKVTAKDSAGVTATLINKVVTVKKAGGTVPQQSNLIQILYAIPETDITIKEGSSFGLGGIIAAKNKMNLITVTLTNGTGKIVAQKSVNPGSKVYILDNSVLDAAIEFEMLPVGSYTLSISARDVQANNVELMKHLVVVK